MSDDSEPMSPDVAHKAPMPPVVVPDEFKDASVQDWTGDPQPMETHSNSSPQALDLRTVAEQVLKGEWGVGQERRKALSDAGYDPNAVNDEIVRIVNKAAGES